MFNYEEYINELEQIVNIDSGTYSISGVNLIGDFFASRFINLGWSVQRVSISDKVGKLLDICSQKVAHYDVLFIGHMDTVFTEGTAKLRPFYIHDGRAYGPGVADMKCGLLSLWHTVKELPENAKKMAIRVILNPDEEITSIYSTDYIAQAAANSSYVFIFEPAMPDGAFCVERKGRIRYEFKFTGISTHAGYIFERENASAVVEMAHWIVALMSLSNKGKDTTVNIGRIEGGEADNVVAKQAMLSMEVRTWEPSEAERVKAAISYMLSHPFIKGTLIEVIDFREMRMMTPSLQTQNFIKLMKKIYKQKNVQFKTRRCGGVSDGNTAAAYAPVVVDRIGPWGDHNHSEHEYMIVESAQHSVEIMQDILTEIALTLDNR